MALLCLVLPVLLGLLGYSATSGPCAHEPHRPAPCLELGRRDRFSRELYRHDAVKSSIPLMKRDEDIVFPPGGASSKWFRLTYVNVTSKMDPGFEGTVTATHGGVGHHHITLHLKSQRGRGFHFHIVIFGVDAY